MDKLEQVREYFKNVKEVKCLVHKESRLINDKVEYLNESIEWEKGNYWLGNKEFNVLVYRDGKYAEIISYKQPLYQLTAKEVVHAYENPEYLKDQFKECFETELEVGKWYKSDEKLFKSIICITKIQQCDGYRKVYYYGIVNEEFRSNYFANEDIENNLQPGTEYEIKSALVKEAIKRGFKLGVEVIAPKGTEGFIIDGFKHEFIINSNQLYFHNMIVFDNGIWAQLKTYTIPEAESKFNIKIKAV